MMRVAFGTAISLALLAPCWGCTRSGPDGHAGAERSASVDAGADLSIPGDAERSATGLISKRLATGHGERRPAAYDRVRLDFVAYDAKGRVKDGSKKRGGPQTFAITEVIAGFREALLQMRVGEQRRLWIPDQLVYPGRAGYPRAASIFDLTLLEILPGEAPRSAPEDVAAPPTDATRTSSGLAYKFLRRGDGHDKPRVWDRVAIHYTGWTPDGVMIEGSTRERASVFDVRDVMPGWREALVLLSVGDRVRLWVPEALAYEGRVGMPHGSLTFDIELASIEHQAAPPRAPDQLSRVPSDAVVTQSGLAYRIVRKGHGTTRPTPDDRVEVEYSAWTQDGTLFDSSALRGRPAQVPVKRLIAGWAEGLQHMVEGDKALLWIPERLAYGGRPGAPSGMLVYEVELLKVLPHGS